jgi:lipopolysaccharide/colanic/teichoic acid biosynthesis glycosyltransferase
MEPDLKRFLDVVAAATGLMLLSPVFLLIALAIRLTSRGPVLFRQERVGRDGRRFRILKFRTMIDGADRRGRPFTVGGDRRVTRIGRFLRRLKLDELPQLVNVLGGEMSLVGPRPEVPRYVEMFLDEYEPILRVRPGITHRATLLFRDEERLLAACEDPERAYIEEVMPHKLRLYTETLSRGSVLDDVRVIMETVLVLGHLGEIPQPRRRPLSRMAAAAGSEVARGTAAQKGAVALATRQSAH